MNGYWFKLWSVLPYGTSRFLWFRLKTPFYCLWYKQGVLRTYSKKDHNGIPFIQRFISAFYTLHMYMYMYIIRNRQWHLEKSTVLLHCPFLLWKLLKKFKDALFCHCLKACVAVPVTISTMGAGYLFINHPWQINYQCNGDLSTLQLQWRIQRVYWSPIWNCNPYWISFENFCISSSIPYAILIMMSFIV